MANKKKKKKNSKQAAAAYKGKQSSAVKKSPQTVKNQPKSQTSKPAAAPVKKDNNKQSGKLPTEQRTQAAKEKAPVKNKKPVKAKQAAVRKPKRNGSFGNGVKLRFKSVKPAEWLAAFTVLCMVIGAAAGVSKLVFDHFKVPDEAVIEYAGRDMNLDELMAINYDAAKQEKLVSSMQRKGDVKKFGFYAETYQHIEESYEAIEINLANPVTNDCAFIVSLVDTEGNLYYRSLGIPNGYILPKVYLRQDYPYGTFDFKLVVSAYDKETFEHIGTQYSDLTIEIGYEEETSTNVADNS